MEIRAFEPQDQTEVIALWDECALLVPWNNPARDIHRKLQVDRDLCLNSSRAVSMKNHRHNEQYATGLLKYLVCGVLLLSAMMSAAADYGYDPDADPAATYEQALQQAANDNKLVLLVFGSQWCPDCRSLNKKMGQAPLDNTIASNFVVAHIDIGNWDRNMAFTGQFGKPVAKGIPSIAIVAPDGTVLYVSEAGEFASARSAQLATLDDWFTERLAQIGKTRGTPIQP